MFSKGGARWIGALVAVGTISLAQAQEQQLQIPQEISGLREAVTQGVLTSPKVNASWYNFEASREAQRGAWGGYLPSVDLYGEYGREERETPLVDLDDYGRDAARFSITQMLFDGFLTKNEVSRLGYAKLSRYYDLKRDSEEIASDIVSAYVDTVKYQRLVAYAEENLKVHRKVASRIEERTGGGVSEGVDLDQAEARVALAESNLVTEVSNLHDVMTRFQRLVGSLPAPDLDLPAVPSGQIPELRGLALDLAYDRSPVINSAIENLRSAQEGLEATRAPMMPRLDLRYRNEVEHDTDGLDGRFDEEAIELVLTYNLYRGGSDSARKREYNNLYYAAVEQKKQACLNVRQDVLIGFNDVESLENQVEVLARNQAAQNKTRKAYQDQFDIGQRSLLDLLDSQNEYFDTQRASISAVADLVKAQAGTLADMGLLLASLDNEGINADKISDLELDLSRDANDPNAQHNCPREPDNRAAASAALDALAADNDRYKKEGDAWVLEVKVLFAFDSAEITSAYDEEIARVAEVVRKNSAVRMTVEGHTDSTGPAEYNQNLSERRANAVRDMMMSSHTVKASQVSAVGHGESVPVADNATEEGRSTNRRVQFILDVAGQ
jgi:outer membrane protein, adhesin transport system